MQSDAIQSAAAAMMPTGFRTRYFPQLARQCYFASCSLAAYSPVLESAMISMLAAMRVHDLAWPTFETEVHVLRQRIANMIGARVDQIALMPNASVGAYQIASTLNWHGKTGLVYSTQEFPSIAHVWLAQAARGGAPKAIDTSGNHDEIAAHYSAAIGADTRLVSVPVSCYSTGQRFPVAQIAAASRRAGAKVFVDAYQALGVLDVQVNELGCDFLVGGTMKYLLGLPGLAFLYVRDAVGNDLDPQLTGWFGRKRPFDFDPGTLDYPDTASRFETGTPPIPSIYAANAGLALIAQLDIHAVQSHVAMLVSYATERLLAIGEQLVHVPQAGEHGAHVALYDPDLASLRAFLQEHGITVSPRGNAVRVSFHYFNLRDDIDRLCGVLQMFRALKKDRQCATNA
jgi:selenocysteine lyase/cysteine desulfurase